MRWKFALAAIGLLSSATLAAAADSQTIYLPTSARAGNADLPRGICLVSWTAATGARVRLILKTEDGKTLAVSAHRVKRKQKVTEVVTSVVNGVTYLREIQTRNAGFVIQTRPSAPRRLLPCSTIQPPARSEPPIQ